MILKKIIISIILGISFLGQGDNISKRILSDSSLIVPGIGAEKILLNGNAGDLLSIKGYPEKISEFKLRKEFFQDIYKIKAAMKIYFEKIYYYRAKSLIVFIYLGRISAIAGLNNNRITVDSVNLSNGADYFIFSYGNSGLDTVKKGKNRIYLYSKLGIAIADDRSDDIIDMYIIFSPYSGHNPD